MSERIVDDQILGNQIRTVTVPAAIRRAVETYRDRPMITCRQTTRTYGDVWTRSGRLAAYLDERGFERGDRVGLMLSNRVEYVTAVLGLARGGFVTVPMNDMLGTDEFSHILRDSGARGVIVDDELRDSWTEIRDEVGVEAELAIGSAAGSDRSAVGSERSDFGAVVTDASLGEYDRAVGPEDPVAIQYTGGTTGRPKGVEHTHFGWTMDLYSHLIELDIREGERMLFSTPLPHAAGMQLQAGLLAGAHVFVETDFEPNSFLSTVEDAGVSWTLMVPTMIYAVLDSEAVDDADLSSLQTIAYGAAPIARDRLGEAIDVFGQVFIQAYGLTEVPLLGTVLSKAAHSTDDPEHLESCGRPATMADVRIADPDDKEDTTGLPRGEEGEILLRAPYAMAGYHGLPEKTAETLVDGWVRTGDIGTRDEDGFVYILDRDKDMIVTGGMNVYTTTVEDALVDHPDVRDAAVIGIPDERWGEAVHAVVCPTRPDAVSAADLKNYAKQHLATYETPKSVEFVSELPVTAYGKVDKKALREPHWRDQPRNVGGGGDTR